MKNTHQVTDAIEATINTIRIDHPELVKYLDEMPITIPNECNPEIGLNMLTDYLESLKSLIDKYALNHK